MNLRFLLLLLFVLPAVLLSGQPEQVKDSLLQLYRTTDSDTLKMRALLETGKLYFDHQADSAIQYIKRAKVFAEKTGYEKGVIWCKINLARAIHDKGQYEEARELCASVLPDCLRLGMGRELVAAYNLIGNVWNIRGNYWLAIDFYDKALEAMKTAKVPPHFPVVVNNNVAILYNGLKLHDKAREYAQRSLDKAIELGDDASAGISCEHIGNALLGANREEEAYGWFEKGAAFARKADHPILLGICLGILGDLEMKKGNLARSEAFYRESLDLANKANSKYGQMTTLHGFALLDFEKKQFKSAKTIALRSLAIANELKAEDYKASILLTLSDLALVEGSLDAWNAYRQEYQDIRDTLSSNALVHAVQELETKYETEQKEQKIKQLEQDRELQSLRLQRQRAMTFGAGGLAFLLLSGGLLAWRFQRNKELLVLQQVQIQGQTIRQLEQEKQITTANAVMRGQEEERGRLARDLHDGLGGMLSGIKQTLFAMKGNQVLTETSALALNQVIGDMDRSIGELRHIARNMMPEALVRFGLKDALHDYCEHIRQGTSLAVHFQAFGLEERLPQHLEVVLFRIAQELLNNVAKHAAASQAIVQLLRDGERISLTVEDNGRGMDPAALERVQGVGWMNIRSRVSYLDGTLDLRSKPGEGTSVSVEFLLSSTARS